MPRVTGWSEDEFDDRAQDLAALIRRVWRAIARLIAAQAESQSQVTLAIAKPIMPQWQQAVDGQIIGFIRDMYLDAAGNISDELNAPDEMLIGDDLVEVYTNAARNRLVGIGDDVWKNVQAQIALGNQSGESIAEIATRIRNVASVSEARSLTIARTEVHAAHESGSYEQAMFVDPNAEKIWLATEDSRTRPSHRAADGQTVKIGETFNVGGSKLRYPGDPLGAAEDCINCRCSVAYNFDMITTVVDEPEPAMVAAGGQAWKAHQHPRGNDGKFIKSGLVADFLKKSKPNIIDVTKAVGNLDSAQWSKLTDAQKTHIKDSVDKLPKGTATYDIAQKTITSLEKSATAAADVPDKPKTKIGATYDKLKDAKHGDVLATGTKYNSAGVGQKFKITADKSNVHSDYNPYGKMKLEFLKKNGEPGQSVSGGPFTISQKLHPLPAKGKKASKVEWDEPDAPQADADVAVPEAPNVDAPSTPTKIPAGLKGAPGDPAKITTGVVWGKHPAGTTIVESDDGSDQIVWNGKKYEFQSLNDIGDFEKQFEMSKKDFYANHKEDTAWKIPGGEKTPPPPFVPDADLLEKSYNPDGDDTSSAPISPEAAGYEPTPDEIDWGVTQWQRQNTGKVTSEHPVASQSQATAVTSHVPAPDPSKLTDTGKVLGSHGARVFKDDQGNDWLFKAQDTFATNMDIGASKLQQLAGRPSPETYAISLNGKSGSIQRMLIGTGDFGHPNYFDAKKLTAAQRREVLREQPVDWLISNFDAHSENFIDLPGGQVLAIDKGNGLKFFGQDSLTDYNWRPNEHRTVYSHLWRDYAAGKFDITSDDLKALSESIEKLQAISDDELKEMFRPYAEEVNKKGWLLTAKSNPWAENLKPRTVKAGDVDAFLDALVQRKKSLKADFEALYATATSDRNDSPDIEKKSLISPELAPTAGFKSVDDPEIVDLLDQVIGDTSVAPDAAAPDAASAKAKMQALYSKGLITWDEFVDVVGESPQGVGETLDPYDGIADKGVLLNDLESGAILSMPQAIDLGIMLNESDYNDLSNMEKNQLETTLSTAANMDYLGGKDAYTHWQTLHNPPTTAVDALNVNWDSLSGPMIDGSSLSLKSLYNIIQIGSKEKKYTDGQIIAVSPDGKNQIIWRSGKNGNVSGYTLRDTDTGTEKFLSTLNTIQTIRSDAYHVPESIAPNHDGTLIESTTLDVPTPDDPVVDTETLGTTNAGALSALDNGDADQFVTLDGKWSLKKTSFSFGDSYVLSESHGNGNSTTILFENPNELEGYSGLQVWYSKSEIDQSKNVPAGTSGKLIDLSTLQEDIDLDKYTGGEVIGISDDGQNRLVYSAFLNGLIYQQKFGNTGEDDLDWDALSTYSDDSGSPVDEFVADYPDVTLYEPQAAGAPEADTTRTAAVTDWDSIFSGMYNFNDVVAQIDDGKFQLLHKGMGNYQLKKIDPNMGGYTSVGTYPADDIINGDIANDILGLSDDVPWVKVAPGTPFKMFPNAAAPKKKVAKAAKKAVPKPSVYTPLAVTDNEKTFYLEDAQDGTLVSVEAIHLLNGENGLTLEDVDKLTPKQTNSINTALEKATNANMPGAEAAWNTWSQFAQDLNGPNGGYDKSQLADTEYFSLVEDDMWAGEMSTGDVFAVSADGKYQLKIHSTEGPLEDPNSFALEQHGPYGWELNKIYTNSDGGPFFALTDDTDTMGKTWLKPEDSNDATSPVSFDPPGIGDATPSVLFNMLSWMPKDKALLVGKTAAGSKYLLTAGKDNNSIEAHYWSEGSKSFSLAGVFSNEEQFNAWVNLADFKWDVPGSLPNQSALGEMSWKKKTPDAPTPPVVVPTTLTSADTNAVWDNVLKLPVGTVLATATNSSGNDIRLTVTMSPSGIRYAGIEEKDSAGNWVEIDTIGQASLKYTLDDATWASALSSPPSPTPTPTYSPVLDEGSKLKPEHSSALWDIAQYLDEDTVIATATAKNGADLQMVVKKHVEGYSILTVQKKHPVSKKWGWWYGLLDDSQLAEDLEEENWINAIDVPGVPDTNSSPSTTTAASISDITGTSPNAPIGSSYWAKLTLVKDNIPGGTIVAVQKDSGSTLIKTYDGAWAVEDADGTQVGLSFTYPQSAWSVEDGDWHTPSGTNAKPLATVTPTAPSTQTVTAPAVPSVTTPAAPKPVPAYKINILKSNMKADGNIGYWSKPEKIWEQIKKFQTLPGNENISPMDFFAALDGTLKTDKHSYVDKMKKWAATKKGAQIIGADGIYGPSATPTSAPTVASIPDFKLANVDAIWDHIQTMKAGDILAINDAENKRLKIVSDTPGQKSFIYESKSSYYDTWSYYAGGSKKSLTALLNTEENGSLWQNEGWKPVTPSPTVTTTTPGGKKAEIPDVESGSDISGIDDAKQKSVYDKFKAQPNTYLSSSEESIFDAMQDVAKSEGLTLAQIIKIVDAQGAKKVNKPDTGLFKQKISSWLKTPDAAAHILNEPVAVKGLVAPPAYHPKYDPHLNPGQIPSFEESSKLTYDYVPSSSAATKIWSDIVAKTSDFSPEEKKALTVWTGGAYTTINGHLINPNPGTLSSTHKSAMKGSQLGMRPSDRPMVVVRGTGYSGLGNAKNHGQLEKMIGTTWRNNGFAATSVGRAPHDEPGVHSPAFSSHPLWIEFECPPGTPMAWVTPFSSVGTGEREMLLGANLYYKIVSVEKKSIPGYGMKTIARVRIVPKPEEQPNE